MIGTTISFATVSLEETEPVPEPSTLDGLLANFEASVVFKVGFRVALPKGKGVFILVGNVVGMILAPVGEFVDD